MHARLIYGDAPKAETYARLTRLSLLELDAAFGSQVRCAARRPRWCQGCLRGTALGWFVVTASPPGTDMCEQARARTLSSWALHDTLMGTFALVAQTHLPMHAQAVLNYQEMLTGRPAVAPLGRRNAVESVLLTQRDATLCSSISAAAAACAQSQQSPAAPAAARRELPGSSRFRQPSVVAVGEAHLQGVLQLWQGDRWRQALQGAEELPGGLQRGRSRRTYSLAVYSLFIG